MTPVSPQTTTTLAPIDCEPWCTQGDGHTDARHPGDQFCTGADARVNLTRHPLLEGGDGTWDQDHMRLYLLRENDARTTTVELCHNEQTGVSLTPAEAIALGHALVRAGQRAID